MRILIISDVHANLVALESVLAAAGTVDGIWNLGDTIGYGPRPRECIERLRALNASPTLAGNHDLACLGRLDLSTFNVAARAAAAWTARQLSDDHRSYLDALPSSIVHGDVTLAHGSPRSPIWEYVTSDTAATENFSYFDTPVCLIGHSHVACFAALRNVDSHAQLSLLADGDTLDLSVHRWLINPGSVGQPRDHDPRAAHAILDTNRATISVHRTAYDIASTQAQMTAAGLPDRLIRRLSLGV